VLRRFSEKEAIDTLQHYVHGKSSFPRARERAAGSAQALALSLSFVAGKTETGFPTFAVGIRLQFEF